ncbi:MAG: hypothetical protein HOP15_07310, partial [Planctomycetes bacterium]|nr:hypothetical protein [Planctomycetota bacterium]
MLTTETLALGAFSCLVACATPRPEARAYAAIQTTAPQDAREPLEEPATKWTQAELEKVSREIMADIERLRGEKFLRPVAVKVSTKAELLDYIKLREAKTETPEKRAADELIAKMLGVVPHDMDLRARTYALLESQVGGFYDPDSDSFSLMDKLPVPLTKITLAHELDHALDDQLFGIDATLERVGPDSDATMAFQAVVEGAGTAVMTQWMVEAMTSGKGGIDMSALSEKQVNELASMAGAPDWLWKPMMAVYSGGAAFLARTTSLIAAASKPLDGAAVRTAFERPPRSTEQVLHPDKYWKEGEIDEPRRITFDTAGLDDGWKVLREDTLGELALGIITTPPGARDNTDFSNPMSLMSLAFTNDISSGWGGDRIVLVGKDDARVLRWVTVWDSARVILAHEHD